MVWYVEKEFNVGPIYPNFPIFKLFNLFDSHNIKQYNKMQKRQTGTGSNTVKTAGKR